MDDVQGDYLGPPHGTTPAAVIANKYKGLILWKQYLIYERGQTKSGLGLKVHCMLLTFKKM